MTVAIRVLAIAGSLRAASSNVALLRAAARLAPDGMTITLYEALGALPHFNPDLDVDPAPSSVRDLRAQVGLADCLLVSCPEYAHGVPGVFKNALDWLVSALEPIDKPIVLLNASPSGGHHAHAQLIEILTTMNLRLLGEASRVLPFVRRKLDATVELDDPEMRAALRSSLDTVVRDLARMRAIAAPVAR